MSQGEEGKGETLKILVEHLYKYSELWMRWGKQLEYLVLREKDCLQMLYLNEILFYAGRKVRSGYLPFRTNASTLPITPKRSSSRDVGTSSYRYHTATYSPANDSANR
ncbi:UNVERIFIED_CONTAM: hypothetical protein NCL1_45338 [Trichonephila clavipes]